MDKNKKKKIDLLIEQLVEYLSSEPKPYIIIRNHFDGDGTTSGAIIEHLLRLFNLRYKKMVSVQNKYTAYDLIMDRNFFRNMKEREEKKQNNQVNNDKNNDNTEKNNEEEKEERQRIIYFILDFGSNEETAVNMLNLKKYLKKIGFEPFFVLIDHHLMENPSLTKKAFDIVYHHMEKNTSFLVREFFFRIMKSDKFKELNLEVPKETIYFVHEVSYIGVLSDNFEELLPLFSFKEEKREELIRKYYILEYITNISKFSDKNQNLLQDLVFNFNEFKGQADFLEKKLVNYLNKIKKYVKDYKEINGVKIKTLELDKIFFRNLTFPNPKLFLRYLHNDNEILVVHREGFIILRAGRNVEIDFRGLIKLQEKYLCGPGGHRKRFAITFPEKLTEEIFNDVIEFIEKNARLKEQD
jgi:RecJ-like exonuclease